MGEDPQLDGGPQGWVSRVALVAAHSIITTAIHPTPAFYWEGVVVINPGRLGSAEWHLGLWVILTAQWRL